MPDPATNSIPRTCNGNGINCLHCGHARPHLCRNPSDVCIQGNKRAHFRVNVECQPIPCLLEIDALLIAVEDEQEAVVDAQAKLDDATDELDDAERALEKARAVLHQAETIESARDYCDGDNAAIAALPVI
jgi:hypothetical protein